MQRIGPMFRYSHSRNAYVLRAVGGWIGPVFQIREPEGSPSTAVGPGVPDVAGHRPVLEVGPPLSTLRIHFAPKHRQPTTATLLAASVVSLAGSLIADALLVDLGRFIFPGIKHYGHFQFADYAKLTVIGVVIACVAWPVVTRISSSPRWLFFRLAIVVTLVLFLPDLYILVKGQPLHAVVILMCMHVAIALVTYNSLVHISRTRPNNVTAPSREMVQ